jgi:hypothetical protein
MINRKLKMEREYISVIDCKKINCNENTKQCNFTGLCIHQSIMEKGIHYCLRA